MTVSTQVSAVTQCPHCSAKFRVRPEQVKLHAGLVRCGACRGIFDAIEHLVEGMLPPPPPVDESGDVEPPRTIIQGMPEVQHSVVAPVAAAAVGADTNARATGAESSGSGPDGTVARDPTSPADAPSEHGEQTGHDTAAMTPEVRNLDAQDELLVGVPPGHVDFKDYRWRPPQRPASRLSRALFALLSLLALLGLAAQASFHYRDEIASRVPSMAPALQAGCEWLGCRLEPPRRADSLGFVGADLAADPAHRGLLIFTATLRNTGAQAVAYPHLILTLDGLGGELVSRRVFGPSEFAPATANLARGLDAGAEIEIKIYLDASQSNVVGFKVDHAYL